MDISKFCQEKNCAVHIIEDISNTTKIKEIDKEKKPDIVRTNENVLYYLKTIKDGKIGFAKFYRLEDIEKAYKIAIKNATNFKDVEFCEITAKSKDNFKVIDYDPNEIFEMLNFDFEYSKKEITSKYCESKHQIYDPYGNYVEFKNNILDISVILIRDGIYYYYLYGGYNPKHICERIMNEINFQYQNTTNFGKIEDIKGYDIVFYDHTTKEFINFLLEAFDGKSFKENKVWSSSYLNDQVFNENFNLIEDPKGDFIKKYYIDDDGIETSKKHLVEKGIIKTMCYDFYSSVIYNEKPTGNGFYIPNLYGIGFTNIDVNCGKYDSDRYIMVIEELGFHTCNESTGDINFVCSLGFVYDKEEIYAVKNVPISFNLLDVANRIYGFGETKDLVSIKTPNLVIKNDPE